MKKSVRKLSLISVSLGILALVVGCGRAYTGTYTGTLIATTNGVAVPSSQATFQLNQNGSTVTGMITGAGVQGTIISGTTNGDSISNLSVSFTQLGQASAYGYGGGYGNPYGGGYPGYGVGSGTPCGATFTAVGTLTCQGQNCTATLTSQGACQVSVTFQGVKSN